MTMKRLFSPITGLMAIALFALSLGGCQKEDANTILNAEDNTIEQRTALCQNGIKLVRMSYYSGGGNVNQMVDLLNNGTLEAQQSLKPNEQPSNSLLDFVPTDGVLNFNPNFIAIDGDGGGGQQQWINGAEKISIKLGVAAAIAGWKMRCAGFWIETDGAATISVQMKRNGANQQPPLVKKYTGATLGHINLSLAFLFDEIEITPVSGEFRLIAPAGKFNDFVITNNSNHFIALRNRIGSYFWNSMVSKRDAGDNPNYQYLTNGDFVLTANGDQWIDDSGTIPGFINRTYPSNTALFGPATAVNNGDTRINTGDIMSFKLGSDVEATFINAIIPLFVPTTGGAPVLTLKKGGVALTGGTYVINQAPGTYQYHVVGVLGAAFDEIEFSCTSGNYAYFSDYWSVARFSLCPTIGAGAMKYSPSEILYEELGPTMINELPVEVGFE
jgi:hypothetical protein